ncbi:MAG TPA: hypothetical protein VGH57_14450 [Amycolatopsis sp.]
MREICWTDDNEEHISRHGIVPDEVEQVVYTRPRLALAGRENTTNIFGTTEAGRHLLVVLAEALDGRMYVVTARDMSDQERRSFRKRAR